MKIVIYFVLISFLFALFIGPILIPILHKLKFGQNIRKEGPESHQKKAGTPSMGGMIFILASIIALSFRINKFSDDAAVALYALIAFGVIGFMDDYLKIKHKKNEGLKSGQKMVLLIAVATLFAYYGATSSSIGTVILFPFTKGTIDLGIMYIPFIVFYYAAATNAVNLTDGLDGLASSITLLVMTFFALVSFAMGNYDLAIFCGVVAGALLGFLRYNTYPAKVFMGDTGSLALGGAIATVALILKLEIFVVIVGGIYVVEALSVILQVASFKLFKKRIFKMSPIHHHFELSGWHEAKIVAIFSIITAILCLITFISLPVIK
ncbi:MAG: phospho-N-acetylmuramoyl-pentapeptide-transferase [Clostridiaceae bacterium]|nr:phospho-N-acetylmuramoyl-pentapeptide-transferase [Clostridiaceae bacterium]